MNSVPQTNKKPLNLTPRKSKELMRNYPEYYYQEIVKFLRNSDNWMQ